MLNVAIFTLPPWGGLAIALTILRLVCRHDLAHPAQDKEHHPICGAALELQQARFRVVTGMKSGDLARREPRNSFYPPKLCFKVLHRRDGVFVEL
jgi:hypothetical protein